MKISENPDTRYEFEIWFDYTKRAINLIREGAMVAVPNFATNNTETHISILEIVSILPMHYALGSDISGYPGFVVEAAQNACLDWEQETESTEDTTKIRCIAIPTNLELKLSNRGETKIQADENLPMIGSKVELLNNEYTQRIVNLGINPEVENTLTIGNLVRDPGVNIWIRIEDLVKVHFGVFGFTGAGKSNFLSTLVSKILSGTKEHVKIIFFDLMGEYTALLIDQLVKLPNAKIICLEEKTLPDIVFKCLNGEVKLTKEIAEIYQKTTLLPKMLKQRQYDFVRPLGKLIYNGKIKLWQELSDLTVDQAVDKGNPWEARRKGTHFKNISDIVGRVFGKYKDKGEPLTSELAKELLENLKKEEKFEEYQRDFSALMRILNGVIATGSREIRCGITTDQIVAELNDKSHSSLYIINSHSPDILREFAYRLGNDLYDNRRMTGEITPLCLFIFDEADEFIPQQPKGSYELSSSIAMTLARRGRKFGLGLGIATQRVRYLDTSIMAQPHTYFISKLPRQTDREVVSQAFGISEDIFRQTFKFKKGDWLLVSYDATGLDAIPIPIHVENADERIGRFLDEINR
ncbi:MAG: ATP-binding protein [Candidatus Nitrosotenuis sp.]